MLRWRLLGINFCIQPSFWIMNGLCGFALYEYFPAARGGLTLLPYILTWVLCILVSVIVHELGHVIMGRIFGQPGSITVTGLGGQAMGHYEELRSWQRIFVAFAGPCAGFLFVGFLITVDSTYWDRFMSFMNWENLKLRMFLIDHIDPLLRIDRPALYDSVLVLLLMINLFVNIINLFPIIPMDGGMIFKEVCYMIAGDLGLRFAFLVSFLLAAAATLYLLAKVVQNHEWLTLPFEVFYPFVFPEISVIVFGMMAYQCLQMYRQLGVMQRHAEYADND